jgi:hypothetical protein
MQCATRTTARGYREVRLAGGNALLLISSGNGVLETCGVGRVTGDRHVNVLLPVDGYALANIIEIGRAHV